ncbi:hypothetical protein PIB30_062819 [Stylosanthes scabra]|uniref:F-box domain-containing protein n=1 Tax=Stylosanthes scabra TaxID=79078 RepID=A0ABU6QMA6_9FABA|nr:hypothetical protein [Stylosanthes scabra]
MTSSMMHRYKSADAVLGNIDLLEKILLRLPVKELIRSKCVCKNWRYLISEPQFCYRHTLGLCSRQNHKNYLYPSGFLRQRQKTTSLFRLLPPKEHNSLLFKRADIIPFTNNSKNRFIHLDVHDEFDGQLKYIFIRSCSGLLLWKSSPIEFPSSSLYAKLVQESSFYISNPTTGHCVRIDRFGHDDFKSASFSVPFLAFEPWKSSHYKEDYSGWIKKYNVNLTTLEAAFVRSLCLVSRPPNENKEEESMLAILVVDDNTVVSYNLKDHRSRIIYEGDGFGPKNLFSANLYFIDGLYSETLTGQPVKNREPVKPDRF